jgi:hypothetical protein
MKTTTQIDQLTADLSHIKIDDRNKKKIKFIANTIAYVPEYKSDEDSSDEELSDIFKKEDFDFDSDEVSTFPFHTIPPKYTKKTKTKIDEIQFVSRKPQNPEDRSYILQPLLTKLEQQGFAEDDKDLLDNSISISIGLNRMLSLSTRKNLSLKLELEQSPNTAVTYEKFGFYWECKWYDFQGEVNYQKVHKFYKQLKKIDKSKAAKFLESCESNITIPYQELREYAKNHPKTKALVKHFRNLDQESVIYFSLIDADTIDFNRIYSSYLKILNQDNNRPFPTLLSTGYEFSENEFRFASQIDRMIRVITEKHLKLSVYYPEPNMLVLLLKDHETLVESFIATDSTLRKSGNAESVALIRNILAARGSNILVSFMDADPLITFTPERVKHTKSSKTLISFSKEFKEGASPTKKDIQLCKQISQSHFHESVWYTNLFINQMIKPTDSQIPYCKFLLAKIHNGSIQEKQDAIIELKKYLPEMIVNNIISASAEIKIYLEQVGIQYARSENEEKLLKLLKTNHIPIPERDILLLLSSEEIFNLIEQEILDIEDILNLETEDIIGVLSEEMVQAIEQENITFDDAVILYTKYYRDNDHMDLSEIIEQIQDIQSQRDYSIEEIIEFYNNDPMLIRCLTEDPLDIALELAPDVDNTVMEFLDHADIKWIKEQLGESDCYTFCMNLGEYEDCDTSYYYNENLLLGESGGE